MEKVTLQTLGMKFDAVLGALVREGIFVTPKYEPSVLVKYAKDVVSVNNFYNFVGYVRDMSLATIQSEMEVTDEEIEFIKTPEFQHTLNEVIIPFASYDNREVIATLITRDGEINREIFNTVTRAYYAVAGEACLLMKRAINELRSDDK